MTNRERFHKTINYNNPDRVPYLSEGLRHDVINIWQTKGMQKENRISDLFNFDNHVEVDIQFDPFLYTDKYPSSIDELKILKNKLDRLNLKKIWSNYKRKLEKMVHNDQIIFLKVHRGFFLSLGIQNWNEFSGAMIKLIEEPEYVHMSMDLQFEFIKKFVDIILKDLQVDAVIFNEPIGGNEGPLISAEMYEEFALRKYKKLIDLIIGNRVNTIILRTYANIRAFIPILLKYGFNCLWACETESKEMDYLEIRKEFGKDLRLIGGIDLDILRSNREIIRKELLQKIPPLLKSGGYIPIADGRIRENISFENYLYYRRLLEDITKKQP